MAGIITRCPDWEYNQVPNCDRILQQRARDILIRLRTGDPRRAIEAAKDTRILHRNFFYALTPPGVEYYAGHYRGEKFLCLEHHEVGIPGDKRVGHSAYAVVDQMRAFADDLAAAVSRSDFIYSVNSRVMSEASKLYCVVEIAAAAFVYFLEIHPYVNGNGHMGRFLLITILGRQGIFPIRWPLHPRPSDPPYSDLIRLHRDGNQSPLVNFILSCL
jgi:fido (protein-threonine AMPylation protein)